MSDLSLAERIVQAVCELQFIPDPANEDTICVTDADLLTVIENHLPVHVGWRWKHADTRAVENWHYTAGVDKPDPGFSPTYAEKVTFEKVYARTVVL